MRQSFFVPWGKLRRAWMASLTAVARDEKPSEFPGGSVARLALMAAVCLASVLPVEAAQQVLKGHVPPVTRGLAAIGRLDGARHLDLAIGLPLRNRENLTNLLQELYDPTHPNFRHYLTAILSRLFTFT